MRKTFWLALAIFVGSGLHAQSTASDNAALERMRQLREVSKRAQQSESPNTHTPLLSGPDDDPTIAADIVQHEAPTAARKLGSRAEHLSKKGKHEEAIAEFKKALQIDPQYHEAANNLALEYFAAGNSDLAIETLRELTRADPKHVLAFDNLAILLCRLKRYPEAEAVATQAYKMHPFSYKAAYVFGASLANQGKWTPDAKQSLRYASERHPEAKELLAKWPAK
jgi:tetratricopeptide (TPR) repeat protein